MFHSFNSKVSLRPYFANIQNSKTVGMSPEARFQCDVVSSDEDFTIYGTIISHNKRILHNLSTD